MMTVAIETSSYLAMEAFGGGGFDAVVAFGVAEFADDAVS
jgi:hypothetical protein